MLSHEIIKVAPKRHHQPYVSHKPVTLIEGLQVGDWVCYNYSTVQAILDSGRCSVVVEIDLEHKNFMGQVTPYLLMSLNGTSAFARALDYKFRSDPWTRWDDGNSLEKVNDDTKKELLDDFVSNYLQTHLQHAKTYLK